MPSRIARAGRREQLAPRERAREIRPLPRAAAAPSSRRDPRRASDTRLAAKIARPIHTAHQSSVPSMPLAGGDSWSCGRHRRARGAERAACSCSSGRDTDAANAAAMLMSNRAARGASSEPRASRVSISASSPRSSRCARSRPSPRARQTVALVAAARARARSWQDEASDEPAEHDEAAGADGDAAEHERGLPGLPRLRRRPTSASPASLDLRLVLRAFLIPPTSQSTLRSGESIALRRVSTATRRGATAPRRRCGRHPGVPAAAERA